MNEEDLRDCFAMFAMLGTVIRHGVEHELLEDDAYMMAYRMLEARKRIEEIHKRTEEAGIAAVKRVRRAK